MALHISPSFTWLGAAFACLGGVLIASSCAARLITCGRLSGLMLNTTLPLGIIVGGMLLGVLDVMPLGLVFEQDKLNGGMQVLIREAVAGTLVGCGALLGDGCISGNGVQGLGFMSKMSFISVVIFFPLALITGSATTCATALLPEGNVPPVLGLKESAIVIALWLACIASMWCLAVRAPLVHDFIAGLSLSLGLALSQMILPSKVAGFLEPARIDGWDPTLLFVFAGAAGGSLCLLQLGKVKDVVQEPVRDWIERPVTIRRCIGAAVFGVGWGLAGLCVLPGMMSAGMAVVGATDKLFIVFTVFMFASFAATKVLLEYFSKDASKIEASSTMTTGLLSK